MSPRKKSSKNRFRTEEEIYVVISHAHQLMRRIAEQHLRGLGITLVEYNLLVVIDSAPNVTATEIRTMLDASAPSITHIITSLENKGLIDRTMSRTDARRQHVTLSTKGKQVLKAGKKTIGSMAEHLGLPEKWYVETIDRVLDLNTRLQAYYQDQKKNAGRSKH